MEVFSVNVWTYWEGPEPDYIKICIASMKNVCSELIVVTPDNVFDYIPPGVLHSNYLNLQQPALRADCIRAALLALHGGFWLDADTVGLRNPLGLLGRYEYPNALYCTWTKPPVRVLNGYLYLSPANKFAQNWLIKINESISGDTNSVDWCSLGEKLITGSLPLQEGSIEIPRSIFLPIDIDSNVNWFFSDKDYRDFITESTVCFGLNHSWFWYHRRKEMENWRSGNCLIHKLLKSVV